MDLKNFKNSTIKIFIFSVFVILFQFLNYFSYRVNFSAVLSLFSSNLSQLSVIKNHRALFSNEKIVKGSGKSVYVVDQDNIKHHIPDWSTFISLGYGVNDIQTLSDAQLSKLKEGNPITSIPDESELFPRTFCPCNTSREVIKSNFIDSSLIDSSSNSISNLNLMFTSPSLLLPKEKRNYYICVLFNDKYEKLIGELSNYLNIKIINESEYDSINHINHHITDLKDNYILNVVNCLIFANFTRIDESSFKNEIILNQCPGNCLSIPSMIIPIDLLSFSSSTRITCSLSLNSFVSENELLKINKNEQNEQNEEKEQNIKFFSMIIRGMAYRRLTECKEKEFWPKNNWFSSSSSFPFSSTSSRVENKNHDNNNHNHNHNIHEKFTRALNSKLSVPGIIIWTGSTSRHSLGLNQLRVLLHKNNNHAARKTIENNQKQQHKRENEKDSTNDDFMKENGGNNFGIVGWLSTENQYPCRMGSTLCDNLIRSTDYYFPNMPTTKLHMSDFGWACAQRRPLRSLSHTLSLFNPDFVLVVDDDSFVNIKLLLPGGTLYNSLNTFLKDENYVLGELYTRKISKYGFFLGGAGYLFGKSVINRLESTVLFGPTVYADSIRTAQQIQSLSVLKEAYSLARNNCKGRENNQCVKLLYNESNYKDIGSMASLGEDVNSNPLRVIDICVNLMAEEKTCFHSDHSMTRCFFHATYSTPYHIPCGGINHLPGLPSSNSYVGMCMGTDNCDENVHLTCHRWMPSINNFSKPEIVNKENPELGLHHGKDISVDVDEGKKEKINIVINETSTVYEKLKSIQSKVLMSDTKCAKYGFSPSARDYLTNKYNSLGLYDQQVLIYPFCWYLIYFGNSLGGYLNELSCAKLSGAHFVWVTFSVEGYFQNPHSLNSTLDLLRQKSFLSALPDILVGNQSKSSENNDNDNDNEIKGIRNVVDSQCKCNKYCWDDGAAPWTKNIPFIRKILRNASAAYLYHDSELINHGTKLNPDRDFIFHSSSSSSSSSAFKNKDKDKPANSTSMFLPILPDVAIQYRCSDNIGFRNPQLGYGLLPFKAILSRINSQAKFIYILAEPAERTHPNPFCAVILDHLFHKIHDQFPQAIVILKRGDDPMLDFIRFMNSKTTICSASTFCFYAGLANNGTTHFPLTNLIVQADPSITNKTNAPNFGKHFNWIFETEAIFHFKKANEELLSVLEAD